MKTIWTSEEVYQDYLKSRYVDKSKLKQWLSKNYMIKLIEGLKQNHCGNPSLMSCFCEVCKIIKELKSKIEND